MLPAKVEITSAKSAWFTDAFISGLEQEPLGLSLNCVASTTDSTDSEEPWFVEEPAGLSWSTAMTPDITTCSENGFIAEAEEPGLKKVTQPKNVEDAPLTPCAQSAASTSCASCSESESNNEGDEQLGNSQSKTSMIDKDSAQQLRDTVVKECSFLRISSTELHDEVSKRATTHGSIATLRIYVSGLPLTRRAKWLSPLLWSVSAALQRQGCPSKIQSKELYVPMNNAQIRIELVAARA